MTNTVNSAITNTLTYFTDSIKIDTSCVESILVKINKTNNEGLNSAKNVDMNIENSVKMGK